MLLLSALSEIELKKMENDKNIKKKQLEDWVPKEDREIANEIIDAFYTSAPEKVKLEDGTEIDVPESGSLSLLAMGHKGLFAWRKSREKAHGQRIYSPFAARVRSLLKARKEQAEKLKTEKEDEN